MGKQRYSRRDFFRGAAAPVKRDVLRPPGTDMNTLKSCISCADCVSTCPENVLAIGDDGLPFIDFSENGCSFCGDCATACPAQVFSAGEESWTATVSVSDACLLDKNVTCQICTDFCDSAALIFDLSARPAGRLKVDASLCTGCGFCVGACPVDAISVAPPAERVAA